MSTPKTIQCPDCGAQIDIDASFYQQIETQFRQEQIAERQKLQAEVEQARKLYKNHLDDLKAKEQILADEKEKFDEQLRQATRKALHKEREILRQNLRKEITDEQNEAMTQLQRELQAKSKQIAELNATKIEIEQLKREKETLSSTIKMEAELELSKRLSEEKLKLQKTLGDEVALRLRAKDEQIEQMRRDIEAAKRKADQGSMQVQGESLETIIESWLTSQFPFDTIEEVKKGAFGADCIQTVHTRELPNCGIIVYESKNTKAWSDGWIPKLKLDMLKAGADLGVLVTSVYPNDRKRMGFVDGIWVCSLDEFKGSTSLLRESLIRVHKSVLKEENRGDKMTLLYNYLTGNAFQLQLKSIVDGFITMQTELDKERRSLMASWKRRQKLIDGVLQNTTEMYGSLQGIAGVGAIGHIEALELPGSNSEEKITQSEQKNHQ